jgi:hypothetical protein
LLFQNSRLPLDGYLQEQSCGALYAAYMAIYTKTFMALCRFAALPLCRFAKN